MKKLFYIFFIGFIASVNAQVGIGTDKPNSTLQVNGSLAGQMVTFNTSYAIKQTDFYLVYENSSSTAPNHTVSLPTVPALEVERFKGRIYQIKNSSQFPLTLTAAVSAGQSIRVGNSSGASSFVIPSGSYVEIVATGNQTTDAWDLIYVSMPQINQKSNVTLYSARLGLPPTNTSSNGTIDWNTAGSNNTNASTANTYNNNNNFPNASNNRWRVMTKTTKTFNRETDTYIGTAFMIGYTNTSMEIVYDYSGPAFPDNQLDNIYPILTAGNTTTNFPDVFVVSYSKLENVTVNNKLTTRLTVNVTRVDRIGYQTEGNNDEPGGANSNWTGQFIINLVLATKI